MVQLPQAPFTSNSVLDLTITDAALKGFYGGFDDGSYGYLAPYSNGGAKGKVARFRLGVFTKCRF